MQGNQKKSDNPVRTKRESKRRKNAAAKAAEEKTRNMKQAEKDLITLPTEESFIDSPDPVRTRARAATTSPSPVRHVPVYAPTVSPKSPTPSTTTTPKPSQPYPLSFETVALLRQKIKQLEMQDPKLALSCKLEGKERMVELLKQKIKRLELQEVMEANKPKMSTIVESSGLTDSEGEEIDHKKQRGKIFSPNLTDILTSQANMPVDYFYF